MRLPVSPSTFSLPVVDHILHRFGDIASFFVFMTPPLFNPIFGSVPVGVGSNRRCWVSLEPAEQIEALIA